MRGRQGLIFAGGLAAIALIWAVVTFGDDASRAVSDLRFRLFEKEAVAETVQDYEGAFNYRSGNASSVISKVEGEVWKGSYSHLEGSEEIPQGQNRVMSTKLLSWELEGHSGDKAHGVTTVQRCMGRTDTGYYFSTNLKEHIRLQKKEGEWRVSDTRYSEPRDLKEVDSCGGS